MFNGHPVTPTLLDWGADQNLRGQRPRLSPGLHGRACSHVHSHGLTPTSPITGQAAAGHAEEPGLRVPDPVRGRVGKESVPVLSPSGRACPRSAGFLPRNHTGQ